MTQPLERPLAGRVAVVTGGAVRLGRALALGLARRGARVAFTWSSSEAAAEATRAELEALVGPDGVLSLRCDVTAEDQVEETFDRVAGRWGRLDLLVNNAAIFERTPFLDMALEDWRQHLDVNLTGPMLCARAGAPALLDADGGGVIVNVACAGGVRPWPAHAAYCVSKAGLVMLTQVLARELAPAVRVNAVAPGPVLLPEWYDADRAARAVEATALKRVGSPSDVVRAVLFCWDSDFTTGALVPVEGGRLLL